MNEDEILSKAISHYGEPAQVLKCIEELAELGVELAAHTSADTPNALNGIVFIRQMLRRVVEACKSIEWSSSLFIVGKQADNNHVTFELADVSIVTKQMLKIFTAPEEFEKAREFKLRRLAERMQEGESQ